MPVDYTGSFSGSFEGDITASNGIISSSAQVNYYNIQNKPTTISAYQANQIAANSYFRETTYPPISASFDTRITATNARIDGLVAGSGSADWSTLTSIPAGLVSSSDQLPSGIISSSTQVESIITDEYISASAAASGFGSGEGIHTDITALNNFSGSIQSEVDSLTAATSSYLTQVPVGTVSGSDQITDVITDTYISASAAAAGFGSGDGAHTDITALNNFSGSIQSEVDSLTAVTSSYLTELPSGVVSSSAQITITEAQISDLTHTDISSLNTFSGSIQSEVDSLTAVTSSYLTELPVGSVSSSTQITDVITDAYISASAAASGFGSGEGIHTDITALNNFSGSVQSQVDALMAATSSYLTSETDSQTLSIVGDQLSISNGNTITLPTGSTLPSGVVSSSQQITDLGFISSSHTDISSLNTFTGSIQGEVDSLTAATSSYLTELPSGTISSSAQITITEAQISDLTHTDISGLNTFSGSAQAQIDALIAATSSYLTSETDSQTLSISGDQLSISNGNTVTIPTGSTIDTSSFVTNDQTGSFLTELPSGVVSSSAQITITEAQISDLVHTDISYLNDFTASIEGRVDNLTANTASYLTSLPDGVVSSSAQITITEAQISDLTHTDISALNTFTSSIQTEVDSLTSATSSYITISQTSSMSVATASYVDGFGDLTDFNGNRIVSNTDLPSGIYNTNFGTSGSISNFIEKVFFPNTEPVISTTGFTIQEFVVSGSVVGTVSATDAEGQAVTFRTASSYTDDLFRISSGGQITLNTKSTSSMNTDNTPGSGSYAFSVEAVDTFEGVGSKTIYIRVNPNTDPVWRQTSTAGSVISSYTASLNENSTAGAKFTVYFTDAESDTLVVNTGSIPSEFSATVNATNVVISQVTASLDYETTTSYNFTLSVEDQHYTDGDDSNSITSLPILINVVDNIAPVVNNQQLTAINENSSDGTTVGAISATDTEGDTITFSNFTLVSAHSGSNTSNPNITSSLGGTSLYDPHADPFQANSSGVVTRKAGVYLNADVADRYVYQVSVRDSFNNTTDTGLITIPINDDAASSITDNWTNVYVIESAVAGNYLYTNSNGRTGTIAAWTAGTSQMWEITSDDNLVKLTTLTGSITQLQLLNDVSGSIYSYDGTNTINVAVTASETAFETTKQYFDLVVNVAINNAPDIVFTDNTSKQNTNLAVSGSTLVTMSFSDVEGNTVDYTSFSLTDPSGQLNAVQNGSVIYIQALNNLSGSTYGYTASIADTHGFRSNTETDSFTISQASAGTLSTNGNFYVIETALSTDKIYTNSNGWSGTQGDLNVSYSPNYGSQVVQSFTSSDASIEISNTGLLSVKTDISGNYSFGNDINVEVTWQDQYGNIGGPESIIVSVTENLGATATFTDISANLTASIAANTNLVSMSISDAESDTPYSASLSGASAGSLTLVPLNANSSSYVIQNTSDITSQTTLSYTASVFDKYGKSTSYNRTLEVESVPVLWYAYLSEIGVYAADESSALSVYGDGDDDGIIDRNYPFDSFAKGEMGTSVLDSAALSGIGQYSFLVASGSSLLGSNSVPLLSNLDHSTGSNGNTGLLIVFPSSSAIGTLPESMTNSLGGSTAGQYILYGDRVGTGIVDAPQSAFVRYFDMTGSATYPNSSDTRFGVIFTQGDATSDLTYFLMSSSGSAPTSTH